MNYLVIAAAGDEHITLGIKRQTVRCRQPTESRGHTLSETRVCRRVVPKHTIGIAAGDVQFAVGAKGQPGRVGATRSQITNVVAQRVQFLGTAGGGKPSISEGAEPIPPVSAPDDEDIPF